MIIITIGGHGSYRGRGGFSNDRDRGQGNRCTTGYGDGGNLNSDKPMPPTSQYPVLVNQPLAHGTVGRHVELVSNFYKFDTSDVTVFHYDVDIIKINQFGSNKCEAVEIKNDKSSSPTSGTSTHSSPDTEEAINTNLERFIKKFSYLIIQEFVKKNIFIFGTAQWVYDGYKNFYTIKELNFGGKNEFIAPVNIHVDNHLTDFVIKLKLVERIKLGDVLEFYNGRKRIISERIISTYEIVFRFIISHQYGSFQRKFFDMTSVQTSPKVQLAQFLQGFTSAVRMTEVGLALNFQLKTGLIIHQNYVKLSSLASVLNNIWSVL